MTRDEIRTLLAYAAATTRDWAPTSVDVDVWLGLLDDLPYDDAHQALMAHAKRTHHRPVPADIRTGARQLRTDRLERAPHAVPAADPDDVSAWIDDLRADRTRDAGALPGPQPRQLHGAFRDVPTATPAAIEAAKNAVPTRRSTPTPRPAVRPLGSSPESRHAAPSWPCCDHCTGTDDPIGHPPHRLPCDQCDTPSSTVTLDAQQPAGAP